MTGAFKLAITGTHSTGKSTFLDQVETRLQPHDLVIRRVGGLATRAREAGLPILTDHTIDSTLWIMAEGLRQEAELSFSCDVVLVDRPPLDALAYLRAGLEVSGRKVDEARHERLRAVVQACSGDYGMMVMSVLDPQVPLGPGRDTNAELREGAARHIAALVDEFAPTALRLKIGAESDVVDAVEQAVMAQWP